MTHSFNRLTTIAALDIGSSKVCCLIAKISRDKKINVVGYGYNASKGIKNGIVTDINQATLSVCNAVETAEQMANERINRIIVNISGDRIKSSLKGATIAINRNRPVNDLDIKKVIEKGINKINVEDNELIHCLPTNYRLDLGEEIKDPRNIYGENLSVNILLGMVPDIQFKNLSTVIENAHLEIAEKAFSAYASGLACLVDDEKEIGATIVDIGGGTAEIAVISLGGIVASRSVRMAGDMFDQAIIAFIKRKYNLLIGERTAEQIKIEIGSAYPMDPEMTLEIKGRNLVDGLPKNVVVHSEDVREALLECLVKITSAIKETLERTPPELSADIIDHGITLTGGGALLRGLDKLIESETGIDVHVAEDPLDCVAKGAGAVLDHVDVLHDVLDTDGGHM